MTPLYKKHTITMAEQYPTMPPAEDGREGSKKAFLFYTNWYIDCAASLSDEDLGHFLIAIVRYASFGILPDATVPAVVRSMFGLIRNVIDADLEKYDRITATNRKRAEKNHERCVENQRKTPQKPIHDTPNSQHDTPNSSSGEEDEKKEEARPRFEEVEQYWQERRMKSDAREFYDFYERRDWIGKRGGRIQSWKKAALLWDDKFRRDVLPLRRREEAAAKAERSKERSRENERIRQEERLAREAEEDTRAARAVDHRLGLYMYRRALELCHGDETQAMRLTQQASTDPKVFEMLREGWGEGS